MIYVTDDGERVVCPACGRCDFDDEGRCKECNADVQPQEQGEESKS